MVERAAAPQAQVSIGPNKATAATRKRHRQQAGASVRAGARRSSACLGNRISVQARQLAPPAAAAAPPASSPDIEVDVCVLGSGIIGLCTSLALLRADPKLRVALVDSALPCAGATGAGQGYLWLAHRDPASPAWQLAVRSRQMWQELLAPTVPQLTQAAVEWQVRLVRLGRQAGRGCVWPGLDGCLPSHMQAAKLS